MLCKMEDEGASYGAALKGIMHSCVILFYPLKKILFCILRGSFFPFMRFFYPPSSSFPLKSTFFLSPSSLLSPIDLLSPTSSHPPSPYHLPPLHHPPVTHDPLSTSSPTLLFSLRTTHPSTFSHHTIRYFRGPISRVCRGWSNCRCGGTRRASQDMHPRQASFRVSWSACWVLGVILTL